MKIHLTVAVITATLSKSSIGNPDEKRLFDVLMPGYNKLIRPVKNDTDVLKVKLGLRLSQLLDVLEKNQIMTTNVWLRQEWEDSNFIWDPNEFGGVESIYIPAERIWVPGIVLYNNADGNYAIKIMTKAHVIYNGTVVWEPPALYRSMCQINVRWFPFDEQNCNLIFGSWTYDATEVDLIFQHKSRAVRTIKHGENVELMVEGIDIAKFYPSQEWDLMAIPSERHENKFSCCPAPYVDITFYMNIRRKTLFYTVNLIVPCVGLSLLTVIVFFLPSDSMEKVVLSISILIALTWFFLLLLEVIPSTSLDIPLIGLYLLFTMVIVTLSIMVTVVTLNVHHRSPERHHLPRWIKRVFMKWLPKVLGMERPRESEKQREARIRGSKIMSKLKENRELSVQDIAGQCTCHELFLPLQSIDPNQSRRGSFIESTDSFTYSLTREPDLDPMTHGSMEAVHVANHFKESTLTSIAREDWRFIAMVMDRVFLWVFTIFVLGGSCWIIMRAPVIWDSRQPLTQS